MLSYLLNFVIKIIKFKYCLYRSNKNQHGLMLFNGNRSRHTASSVHVKTGGSTQSSDYYETKTMVAWKTYWASVDSTVNKHVE